MAKSTRVKYFTEEKVALINPENWNKYEKYLKSNIIKNREVESTTYKVYTNYMKHFLVYLAEEWKNIDLYSETFMTDAVDIMEGFISFCQETLKNNKKVINTKLSTVSTFFHWSVKRKLVTYHPFDKRLDRMKGSAEEHITNSYFLNDKQVAQINEGLKDDKKFDIQDRILFNLSIDSANRISALSKTVISDMDLDECCFKNVREKRGYRVEIAFEESTRDMIEEWLLYRKDNLDKLEVDSLFITKYNGIYNTMTVGTLQKRINKMGEIIGIKDYHSHCNRKTAINSIMEKTGDITLASEIANHKSIETTKSSYIKPKTQSETRKKIKEQIKIKGMEQKRLLEEEEKDKYKL
jgi:integrase/recombinase XerC